METPTDFTVPLLDESCSPKQCLLRSEASTASTTCSPSSRAPSSWQLPTASSTTRSLSQKIVTNMGPGLMACFADTDGPGLITAAQSGAEWGYSLLAVQVVLVPILFFAQELTARLGIVRGMGMTAMLRHDIGPKTAWLVALPLLLACLLGLISEFCIIGQTMRFWGVPVWVSNAVVCLMLTALAATGSYSSAERIGLAMGVCQVVFFATIFLAKPDPDSMLEGLSSFPVEDSDFVKLVTANIGAVIMPWMLAYQQSAICNKDHEEDEREQLMLARIDTGLGSLLTQGVMAAMLVTVAATIPNGRPVASVHDLLEIFGTVLGGEDRARWLLTFSVVGACMVAAIVQTLCAAWTLEQAMGRATAQLGSEGPYDEPAAQGLQLVIRNIQRRPVFYLAYALACGISFTVATLTSNVVALSVLTEFLNGLLMPPVIFSLWYLSAYKLPEPYRLGPVYRWAVFGIFFVCSVFCVGSVFDNFQS